MIKISYNEQEEMMKIEKDEKIIFIGNYWDFPREPKALAVIISKCGVTVSINNLLPLIG